MENNILAETVKTETQNYETYLLWKSELEAYGRNPDDMVMQARSAGLEEYADQLNAFILEMEDNHKKLLHPSVDVLRVDGTDKEALEIALVILHDLGWFTQQCGFDEAIKRIQFVYDHMPEQFIMACATGHAALHRILGRTV